MSLSATTCLPRSPSSLSASTDEAPGRSGFSFITGSFSCWSSSDSESAATDFASATRARRSLAREAFFLTESLLPPLLLLFPAARITGGAAGRASSVVYSFFLKK